MFVDTMLIALEPCCPTCARRMKHAEAGRAESGASSLRTFECAFCDVVFSELNASNNYASDRAFDLHYRQCNTPH